MRDLLLDVWNDLREKRLWPVAAALVLGLLVIPITFGRSSGDDGPAPIPPRQQPSTKKGPAVEAVGKQPSSDLGVFDSKDPFQPGAADAAASQGVADGKAQPVAPTSPAPGGSSSAPAGPSAPAEPPSPGSGLGAPTSPGARKPTVRSPSKPRSKLYTYVVDIDFGRTGRERKRRNVKRLTILPNDKRPLLVFLGVTANTRRAVFLADSTTRQNGEGTCRPVRTCTLIYLSTADKRNEHYFADSRGRVYGLELLRIKAVAVKPKSAAKSAASRRRRARSAEWRREPRGRKKAVLHVPVFADSRR